MKDSHVLQAGRPAGTPLQSQTRAPRRILVVDDDICILHLNREVLIHSGYAVDAAEDGEAAWQALNADHYDLLITDHNMPKVTGVELLKKLRAAHMALPVIMTTGAFPNDEFTRYPWLQPTATLLKPFPTAELLRTVNEVLRATDGDCEQIAPLANEKSQPAAGQTETLWQPGACHGSSEAASRAFETTRSDTRL